MSSTTSLSPKETVNKYITEHIDDAIRYLRTAVAIPSVSTNPKYSKDVIQMADDLEASLKDLNANITRIDNPGGSSILTPPIILGKCGEADDKHTVLVYGHYDVCDADPSRSDPDQNAWETHPFYLAERLNYGELLSKASGPVAEAPITSGVKPGRFFDASLYGRPNLHEKHFTGGQVVASDRDNTDPDNSTAAPAPLPPHNLWEAVAQNQNLIGRGASDNKGPIVAWLSVLKAHQKEGLALPVNVWFCFEGAHENGSPGLSDTISEQAWLKKVDSVCITDSYWLAGWPCLIYGMRGLLSFTLTVSGAKYDLHSGAFGGTIYEPMTDLLAIMSKLVSPNGTILIDGVSRVMTQAELDEVKGIDFTMDDQNNSTGNKVSLHEHADKVLAGRMLSPAISVHGINVSSPDAGAGNFIPATVTGRFTIRLVDGQDPDEIEEIVKKDLKDKFNKLKTKSTLKIDRTQSYKPWKADIEGKPFKAAQQASREVYKVEPDLIRMGGTDPVTAMFQDAFGNKPLVLLPMGRGDSNAHGAAERLNTYNFITGAELYSTYLYQLAADIPKKAAKTSKSKAGLDTDEDLDEDSDKEEDEE